MPKIYLVIRFEIQAAVSSARLWIWRAPHFPAYGRKHTTTSNPSPHLPKTVNSSRCLRALSNPPFLSDCDIIFVYSNPWGRSCPPPPLQFSAKDRKAMVDMVNTITTSILMTSVRRSFFRMNKRTKPGTGSAGYPSRYDEQPRHSHSQAHMASGFRLPDSRNGCGSHIIFSEFSRACDCPW